MKKLLCMLLAFAMVLSLTACFGPRTPQQVIMAVFKNMSETESGEFTLEMKMGVEAAGFPAEFSVSGTGEFTMEPQMVHSDLTVDVGIVKVGAEMYSEIDGENRNTYAGIDLGGNTLWGRDTQKAAETVTPADAVMILQSLEDIQEAPEKETLNGVEGTRYSTVIRGEDIEKIMNSMDQFADSIMGEEMEEDKEPTIGPDDSLPVSILVDRENLTLMEIRFDLAGLLGDAAHAIPGVEFQEYSVTMQLSNLNGVESIVIPDEARNAPLGSDGTAFS